MDSSAPPHATAPGLPIPTLWLLGKTGAGKTSLIRAMTRAERAEIGNGFVSCTRTAEAYDFPAEAPVMRFLDTRGLGEVAYDPTEDLAQIRRTANAALVLLRLDDPVQGAIADIIARLRADSPNLPIIVLHTAPDLLRNPEEQERMRALNQATMEKAWRGPLPWVTLDLSRPLASDLGDLNARLLQVLPSVVNWINDQQLRSAEEEEFQRHRALVLKFASGATAAAPIPFIGAASVPAVQVAMLRSLAQRYDVEWSNGLLTRLGAALGASVLGGQALGLAARELARFIPVIGQTAVPVAAAGWGYASTWALGRAAGWWFWHMREGHGIDEQQLRERFTHALKDGGRAAS